MDLHYELLEQTAKALVAPHKGVLAADESAHTCQKRFDAVNVPCTEETRRTYRQLLFKAPDAPEALSGVILYDETFWQRTDEGQPMYEYLQSHGILPGIKVDEGLVDLPGFPNEKISKGLDDLPERMQKYAASGAKFAKWRSVITIGDGIPTNECIGANTYVLARYARICQEAGIVPFVEPEVLFDGDHTIDQCEEVMNRVFDLLFQTMRAFKVHLPGAVLKTSMVLPGKDSGAEMNHDEIADRTCRVLHHHVPHELGGVVFLSGGQKPQDALINLNKIAQRGPHPWGVTFSYSRALQDPVLKAWAADGQKIENAQRIFARQLKHASEARDGELDEGNLAHDSFVSHSQDL
jgi:fructose-bisphosphate aldolase class I